jgi:thioredoxin reductase (NADPH)
VLVLEGNAPGGQAARLAHRELPGFPGGLSGEELCGRAVLQAEKFGAQITVAQLAASLACDRRPFVAECAGGVAARGHAVLVATGAEYRKLPLASLPRFEGLGIYYAATHVEAQLCEEGEIIVVGGGNSAGQAATFLAGRAKHVHILVRAPGLAESMSRYLIRRIEESPNITLRARTEITGLEGDSHLEHVTWRSSETGTEDCAVRHELTGANPNTAWLKGCVTPDEKQFITLRLASESHDRALAAAHLIGFDESAAVCRGRRAIGQREARRLGGGRRLCRGTAHPQSPGGMTAHARGLLAIPAVVAAAVARGLSVRRRMLRRAA